MTTTKLTRYSPGGYGAMVPDTEGDWIRYSEIKPRIEEAVETAVTNGLLAGSIIADENADEMAKLRDILRWRKFPEEVPTEEGEYQCAMINIPADYRYQAVQRWYGAGKYNDKAYFGGQDRDRKITHWRPIGPMPQEGGE